MAILGSTLWFQDRPWWGTPALVHTLYVLLLINGLYLSFVISPFLLRRERDGKATELLPPSLQRGVMMSFIVSFTLWWGTFLLIIWDIAQRITS